MKPVIDLLEVIAAQEWDRLERFSVHDLVEELSFRDGFRVACQLSRMWVFEDWPYFKAVELMEAVCLHNPQEWNSAWQYEAILGDGYLQILEEQKQYEAFRKAADLCIQMTGTIHPHLCVALAFCSGGETPSITDQEAIELLKLAVREHLYYDAVTNLCCTYRSLKDEQQQRYWESKLEKAKEVGDTPSIGPDFLEGEGIFDFDCLRCNRNSLLSVLN